jgi:hypothetical protein
MAPWRAAWFTATTVLALVGAGAGLWALLAPRAAPPPAPAPAPAAIETRAGILDLNEALILVRTAVDALNQANQTGNYTVLRDLGAPGFRAGNTPERLAEIFADLRANRYDLSPAMVLEPRFLIPPRLEANGQLRMAGFVPSLPLQMNFDLLFAPTDGRWRLFGIAITVGPPGPAAPQGPAPPAPLPGANPSLPPAGNAPQAQPASPPR